MKSLIKRISYKMLIVSMIMIVLSFFFVSSVVHAKLELKEGEFYYTGTQESELVVEDSLWARIKAFLSEIIDYLLGIMTLGVRGIVVGWIEIMELILTALLNPDQNFLDVFSNAVIASGSNEYSDEVITIEKILFNDVELLDANIFNFDEKSK